MSYMKYDARKLSTEEQHLLRRLAVQRVFDGEAASEVTCSYGLGDRTIYGWLRIARENRLDALAPKPRFGRGRALSDFEADEVKRWILGGDPRQYGFYFGLWTRQIVSDLIKDRFSIDLGLTAVGNLLYRLGLSPQKPMRRVYERDDTEMPQIHRRTFDLYCR
ncbi:MAG TPA: transposase [Gammaproteobacteria bacterium]|nr:transposase [Gammaproteobacteria bacterium]